MEEGAVEKQNGALAEEPWPYPPAGDVLQTAVTVAGVAYAAAALTLDRGPQWSGIAPLPAAFTGLGFVAVVASLYAVRELLWEAELPLTLMVRLIPFLDRFAPPPPRPDNPSYLDDALVLTAWSIWLLSGFTLILISEIV